MYLLEACHAHVREALPALQYDRMMIWCHLHKELACKPGITNYTMKEYESDYDWLMTVSQEELIESLRSDGRRQAANRQLRIKQQELLPATQFEECQVREQQCFRFMTMYRSGHPDFVLTIKCYVYYQNSPKGF